MILCSKYYGKLVFLYYFVEQSYLHAISMVLSETYSNVLSSEDININEYYLKNDLLNYMDSIIYDEKTTKRIDQLLLFRFDINTHSITVRIK